mmetsp:Transcript_94374/g.253977  ORF Transcript_94374/g.253977 Transcript_94374/m.253977 type:complete len:218 (-) Transcript_94374:7-660(-)
MALDTPIAFPQPWTIVKSVLIGNCVFFSRNERLLKFWPASPKAPWTRLSENIRKLEPLPRDATLKSRMSPSSPLYCGALCLPWTMNWKGFGWSILYGRRSSPGFGSPPVTYSKVPSIPELNTSLSREYTSVGAEGSDTSTTQHAFPQDPRSGWLQSGTLVGSSPQMLGAVACSVATVAPTRAAKAKSMRAISSRIGNKKEVLRLRMEVGSLSLHKAA